MFYLFVIFISMKQFKWQYYFNCVIVLIGF